MRKLILLLITFLLTVFGIITLYNTFTSFSRQLQIRPSKRMALNDTLAIARLSAALRIPLVSNPSDSIFRAAVNSFPEFLKEAFPNFHQDPSVRLRVFGKNSILYRWTGRDNRLKPILLIARIDVQDPDLKKIPQWKFNPFMGKSENGFIWGAGTMEGKSAAMAILEALELGQTDGKMPQRSLYLALINESDNNNKSAEQLAELLKNEGLEFEFILGAESYISDGVCLGLSKQIAMIGCAERFELAANIRGYGAEQLKQKLEKLSAKKMSVNWNGKAGKQLIGTLTPELPFGDKWILSNRYFFSSLIASRLYSDELLGKMLFPEFEIRELKGSDATLRWLIPPDTDTAQFKKLIKSEFDKELVEWNNEKTNIRNISNQGGYAYEAIQSSIRQGIGEVLVIPGIDPKPGMLRYFVGLSPALYNFRPWSFDMAETERLNSGIDHRLSLKQYLLGVNFYRTLFNNTLF